MGLTSGSMDPLPGAGGVRMGPARAHSMAIGVSPGPGVTFEGGPQAGRSSVSLAGRALRHEVPRSRPLALGPYRGHLGARLGCNLMCLRCGSSPRDGRLTSRWSAEPCAGEVALRDMPSRVRILLSRGLWRMTGVQTEAAASRKLALQSQLQELRARGPTFVHVSHGTRLASHQWMGGSAACGLDFAI